MTRKLAKLPVVAVMIAFVGLLFLCFSASADSIEIVYGNYYRTYSNGYNLYNNYSYTYYDEFYLRSDDYSEFEEYIIDNEIETIIADIYLTINDSRTDTFVNGFSMRISHSHEANIIYGYGALGINTPGTHTYHFRYIDDIDSISNSLAFQYKCSNSSYLTLYTVDIDITYSTSTYYSYGTSYIGYN